MKNNQSGRTMLETLCVLAIMAVLTIGSVRGYRYMINRYKANKISETIAFIVTQLRTGYSTQGSYTGLNNEIAKSIGAIPEHITVKTDGTDNTGRGKFETPWGGFINIFPSSLYTDSTVIDPSTGAQVSIGDSFIVEIGNISRMTCNLLITSDWSNISNRGFVGIAASSKTCSNLSGTGSPVTNAGGCGTANTGLDSIIVNGDYETRRSDVSGTGYAYGIPGSHKWAMPVSPVNAAPACNCVDEANYDIPTCSFAIKVY